jgi:hypothetical protein
MHASCYLEADYIGIDDLSAEGLIEDEFVPYSDYYVAVDEKAQEIVGTARIIRPSIRGFPIASHGRLHDSAMNIFATMDPNLCIEVSALATPRKGLQNTVVSTALYAKIGQRAIQERRAYLFAIMDDRLLRIMRRALIMPFDAIGDSQPERAMSTTPMAAYIPRALRNYLTEYPGFLELFADGIPFSEINELELDLRDKAPEHFPATDILAHRAVAV